MRFLVDTNVLAEPMKPTPNPSVVTAIQAHLHEIAVSAPAWHEMWFGCLPLPSPSKRRAAIETYLERGVGGVFPILGYDSGGRERLCIPTSEHTPTAQTGRLCSRRGEAQPFLVQVEAGVRTRRQRR